MTTKRFYDDAGRGTPLILLHAFPTHRKMWARQVEGLSKDVRVIAPDFIGFGDDRRPGPSSLVELADDIKALADELGLKQFVLGGLSMGGYVAQAFATKYPDALLGLILMDTKSEADTPDGKAGREKMIKLAKEKGVSAVADEMLPKLLAPDLLRVHHPVVAELKQIILANRAETLAHTLAAMRDRPDRTADMAKLDVPALVIHGDADAIIPLDVAKKLAQTLPNGRLHVASGSGHMSSMEKPDDVNAAIRTFVDGLR